MLSNKMTLTKVGACKLRKNIVLFLAGSIVIVTALAASLDVHAAGKVKIYGLLTSIEDDGSVIIDEKGYLISPSADVRNYQGGRITLRTLLPSCYVHFEYEQQTGGFVILSVKEVPQ